MKIKDPIELLQTLADEWVEGFNQEGINHSEVMALAMAKKLAVKKGDLLEQEAIDALIEDLFSCDQPKYAPNGKEIMVNITMDEIKSRLEK